MLLWPPPAVRFESQPDYDREIDFSTYKTYAFYKPGIDQVQVSELDKKRILRAIDANLSAKGLTKSENPDMAGQFLYQGTRTGGCIQRQLWLWLGLGLGPLLGRILGRYHRLLLYRRAACSSTLSTLKRTSWFGKA